MYTGKHLTNASLHKRRLLAKLSHGTNRMSERRYCEWGEKCERGTDTKLGIMKKALLRLFLLFYLIFLVLNVSAMK